ncbi:hypothetical protein [Gangjinia marincola]
MKLSIKSILLFILLFTLSLSLYSQKEVQPEVEKPSDDFFFIQIGLSHPFLYGDNFATNAYRGKTGVEYNMGFSVLSKIIFEGGLSWNNLSVKDDRFTGNLQRSRISRANLRAGYMFQITQMMSITPKIGYSHVKYKNTKNSNFKDTGNSLSLSTTIQAHFDKTISIYLNLINYTDFLDITTNDLIQDQFDQSNSFIVSIGVQLNILNNSATPQF